MIRFAFLQFLRGFSMGTADIVPGVSGGTIALLLGIYERLVSVVAAGAQVLAHLVRLNLAGALEGLRRFDWIFVIPLLAGILVAVAALASLLDHLLEEYPVYTIAAFFGLVVASIFVAAPRIRRRRPGHIAVAVAVAATAFVLLGLRSAGESDPALWFVFVAGMVAICAMILPGISGSFVLLLLGVYDYVLDAVDGREIGVLVVFLAGAVLGLALFSSLLDWLLARAHDLVLAALIGLMAGSLRVLWPWPAGSEETGLGAPDASQVPLALLCAVGGAIAVLAITMLADRSAPPAPAGADAPADPATAAGR